METVLAFVVVFGSLVFFHELGHFLFAKKSGIMVREFAIGFGPKILGITKGETLYTVRLLPLGGYVRMAGQDFDTVELQPGFRVGLYIGDTDEVEKIYLNQNTSDPSILFLETEASDLDKELYIEGYDDDGELVRYNISRTAVIIEKGQETIIAPFDRQFESKPLFSRTMTIFAGPLFNFILSFFIFVALGLMQGIPTNEPIVTEVQNTGSAHNAGMKSGDYVKEVDGKEIASWPEFVGIIRESPGTSLNVIVERNGELVNLDVVPATIKEAGREFGQIGVLYTSDIEKGPLKAIVFGAEQTWFWFTEILRLLGMLVTGQFTIDALSGPVGIYQATGEVAKAGIYNLMHWAGILSINLGIMNLLPLPALDGGRLLFFFFEAVRGKPVDRQKEGMVHFVGIVLLMVLMLVVTWNDIQRFFFS